ncbi:protein RGF1 INDUCIBLE TRANSCRIPTION FACTOR 1-like [Prosopis cineraria]|uniref:protein RGF1 INDUCIBLE TRANSCRIPTION FACTOR 1-like n=1 Tax=Prosopis cineraria TaxID=364024 RepID=UPI0024103800|nr:protein RGF1 INDUCIBLE TRANSCRIPTION FACTOR 1-like [Prosopis cineraria]
MAQRRVHKPRWLEPILKKTFFDSCVAHPMHKNERNKYCMTCNKSACQYCVSHGIHRCHKMLSIFKHVYKYVVALAAVEKHIDCSHIQTYTCNKRLVIALNPLPHGCLESNTDLSCETCGRRLNNPRLYRYCSISCKVKAVLRKPDDSLPPFITKQRPSKGKKEKASVLRKPINKRKGTPRRAPFF